MSGTQDQQQDPARLQQRADDTDRKLGRMAQEDVVIDGPRRLFIRSASGTYWQLTATDAGALVLIGAGTRL